MPKSTKNSTKKTNKLSSAVKTKAKRTRKGPITKK